MNRSYRARLWAGASAAALALFLSSSASAQTFVEPSIDALTPQSSGTTGSTRSGGFGFSTGKLSRVSSLETQFIYFSKLADITGANVASSRAFFFSGGYLIGPWIRERAKVYGAIGFGEMHRRLSLLPTPGSDQTSVSSNYFTLDWGIGVIGLFSRRLGVRGDLRRGRAFSLSDSTSDETGPFGIHFKHVNYWRASIGFVAIFGPYPTGQPRPHRERR